MGNLKNEKAYDFSTTVRESNAIIMRKGRNTLLGSKIMLYGMLKIEDRTEKVYTPEEMIYYKRIENETKTDYTTGLVAEINMSDLKRLMNKKGSGSFYTGIRTLFDNDVHNPKSLRNQWAVLLPDSKSNILGYTEIIVSSHYDPIGSGNGDGGKLFIKFNDEKSVRDIVYNLQEEYTSVPLSLMSTAKSIYEFRLTEIIHKNISEIDEERKATGKEDTAEYTFMYRVGELMAMFGTIDLSTDEISKKLLTTENPDYNAIASDYSERHNDKASTNGQFRTLIIDVAIKAINNRGRFKVSYNTINGQKNKIIALVFNVTDLQKIQDKETSVDSPKKEVDETYVALQVSSLFNDDIPLSDVRKICAAANYDFDKINNAFSFFKTLDKQDSQFASWFISATK